MSEAARRSRREWYARNRATEVQKVVARTKRLRAENRRRVQELKTASCVDCGQVFPPECMDFDHVRGVKVAGIARLLVMTNTWARIEAEIAKCDLVCANCHRARTSKRR